MKKIISIFLVSTLFMSFIVTAFATESKPTDNENIIINRVDTANYDKAAAEGKIVGIENNFITLETETGEVVIITDENTVFVDMDGNALSLNDLHKDYYLSVVTSNVSTMSIPPQTYGYVVMVSKTNTKDEFSPIYFECGEIHKTEQNKELISTDGMYRVVLDDNTVIKPFRTKNIVKKEDITYKSKLLVFSKTATASIPALLSPEKIILLDSEKDTSKVLINGEDISVDVVNIDNVKRVPIRIVAEKLGYNVDWDEKEKKVTIGTIPMGVNFIIGENKYYKSKMMPSKLTAEPIIIEDRTYVPIDFFSEILEVKVEETGNGLNFIL